MLDQALDATQALGQRKETTAFEKAFRSGKVRLEHDRDHAAECAHLSLGELVLRMRREPRVVNAGHFRVRGEPSAELVRVLAMPLHAQCKRLESAQGKKTVERSADAANRVLKIRQTLG